MTLSQLIERCGNDKVRFQRLDESLHGNQRQSKGVAVVTFGTTEVTVGQLCGIIESPVIGFVVWLPTAAVKKAQADELAAAKAPAQFKSIIQWPAEVRLGDPKNESTDTHGTREQAQAVCDIVRRDGLGGEGKIFPIATRVEEVQPTAA